MKTCRFCCVPVLALLVTAGAGQAWYRSPALKVPLGYAPDACGPGFYTVCANGYSFGPNYCVYPSFPPFNGLLPADKAKTLEELQGRGIQHQPPPKEVAPGPKYPGPAYVVGPDGRPYPGYTPNLPGPRYTPYGVPLPNPGYSPPMPVQQPPAFPSHPFARSPRDFFMWSDVMQDRIARAQRPALVP